ncbi:DMT family transporter [Capillibacterium thermochitinicola]|uniref:DMT family transporter n=1 Tax=Capillibacterium thermochitinicola TaxID=2699427 RepID=A0A8J6I122_9FIRM|nr:DMT family transporter [Capillibacterium thermochitinicola]MBA2132729.1 DMT family transporter [Capillibacterium thermochitinicola]
MILSWYTSALLTIFFWGVADVYYKKGTSPRDKYSHLRIVVMVGLVMGLQALFELNKLNWQYDPYNIIRYLPVSFMYILSMTLGYIGLRYLEVSINSPVSNTSGAVAGILAFLVLGKTMNSWQLLAVSMITVGLVAIGIIERDLAEAERKQKKIVVDPKYRLGAIALIFPILYAVVDALGTFLDDVYLTNLMSPEEALISYELTFFFCAVVAFIYLVVVAKSKYQLHQEKDRLLAAVFETAGQYFYVFALNTNSVIVAPMIASYSIVSVLLGRLMLKEDLTLKQYLYIALVMAGIFILGFFE